MSSVLQCLANTEPLTKYFLFDVHVFHLNSKNSLGTRGKLALAFGELVSELFVGQNRYVAPWDVKRIVAMKASQFQGFAQHDSQEMLSVLLETLHEDVNAISKKPYVEYKDSDNRSDAEVSKEYWDGFKRRESSIFIDLFYGQLKSRVQCTQCDRVSITFDPFNVLSLPIPSQKNQCFTIKYLPCSVIEYPTEFQISVGEYVTELASNPAWQRTLGCVCCVVWLWGCVKETPGGSGAGTYREHPNPGRLFVCPRALFCKWRARRRSQAGAYHDGSRHGINFEQSPCWGTEGQAGLLVRINRKGSRSRPPTYCACLCRRGEDSY